jgi:hypothetical protein
MPTGLEHPPIAAPQPLRFEWAIDLVERKRFRFVGEFQNLAQCLAVVGELSGDR